MNAEELRKKLIECEGMGVLAYTGDKPVRGIVYGQRVYSPEINLDKIGGELSINMTERDVSNIYGITIIGEGELSNLEREILKAFKSESFQINVNIKLKV